MSILCSKAQSSITAEAAARGSCQGRPAPRWALETIALALWFGLATGLGEALVRAVQVWLMGRHVFVSAHVAWMAPVADGCLFTLAGALLCLAARLWPRLASLRLVSLVLAFMAVWGPIGALPRLHTVAALVLAVGLAAGVARLVTSYPRQFLGLVRRTLGWLAALVPLLAAVVFGIEWLNESVARGLMPAASAGAPNVLLIVMDTVRAENLSLHGYGRRTTPHLEAIARQGVVFERALSTAPWTLPSHASMFTGRYPHELSADWLTPLGRDDPTLAEALSAQGYLSAGFVGNLIYCTREHGIDRGFVHYEDFPVSLRMIVKSSWLARTLVEKVRRAVGDRGPLVRKTAADVNRRFLSWLSHQENGRPYFAFLNYMDAHEPYLSPEPFASQFAPSGRQLGPLPPNPASWSRDKLQAFEDAYDGAIAYLDKQIATLLADLQGRGLLENTLVIITSDHGEQFGEHGLVDHGNSLYRPLLHVPLVIRFPSRVPGGRRVAEPVTLRDLPATVMDLVAVAGAERFPGSSLSRCWERQDDAQSEASLLLSEVSQGIRREPWLPISKGDMKSLVAEGVHYIKGGDGREELYDFDNDPAECRDLAGSDEGRKKLGRCRDLLKGL